jgi:hypothetical protein
VQVDENGKPSRIPYGLKLEKEQQKMEWEGALLRKKNRMERTKMGF